jgi:hypothetical protein
VLAGRVELLLPMLSAPGTVRPPSLRSALRRLHFDLAGPPVPELLGALLQWRIMIRYIMGATGHLRPHCLRGIAVVSHGIPSSAGTFEEKCHAR